ncbi:MAG: DUF998 domain-containing protein [Candidatus Dormiibacterota bacterium]|jgi:hypothetical protein
MSAVSARFESPNSTARLALLAVAGVLLYVLIDALLAFLRPDVNLIHNAESDYGVGPYSWLMDVNFLLRCGLSLAAAGAIVRLASTGGRLRLGAGFLMAWAVGSGILAFFPDNPAGTPVTTSGLVHLCVAFLAFTCVVIGTVVLSVKFRLVPQLRQAVPFLLSISIAAVVPFLLLGHTDFRPGTLAGLYERIFLGLELVWILLVGTRIFRSASLPPSSAVERP